MIGQSTGIEAKKGFNRLHTFLFGHIEGKEIYRFQLINKKGMQVNILNYGAIIQSIYTLDKWGNTGNVVLGYDNIEEYVNDPYYIGCVVGRYAGRINHGQFQINNHTYHVTVKPEGFHHHGGEKGFNKMIWNAEPFETETISGVTLSYISKDGEEGFPGNLSVIVSYTLSDDNNFQMTYKISTDKATVHNLTQHSYFNLTANRNKKVLAHQFKLNTRTILPVNHKIIPTGEFSDVTDTPFDFTEFHSIEEKVNDDHPQLNFAGGYDHTYVLKRNKSSNLIEAATVIEPESGRQLIVFTTEPTLHFYAGNYLGKDDYEKQHPSGFVAHSGFCLETQHAGDSPNKPEFPSVQLNPGEIFNSKTIFHFSVH